MEEADTAKVVAKEATTIVATEGLEQVVKDIRESLEEPEGSHGNRPDPSKMDVDKAPIVDVMPTLTNQPTAAATFRTRQAAWG